MTGGTMYNVTCTVFATVQKRHFYKVPEQHGHIYLVVLERNIYESVAVFWMSDIQEFDEDELEAELDALGDELELEEQEELDKQLLDVGPAVPTTLPEVKKILKFFAQ